MNKLLAILLPISLAALPADGMSAAAFSVSVNGAGRASDAPYYVIHPGKVNQLALRPDWVALGAQELTATLVRTLPDDRTDESRIHATTKDREIVFDLGAFTAPAQYDFEHGVVYRRGYRFKLTIATPAAPQDSVVFDFHQGPARQAESEALWIGEAVRHVYNSDQTGAQWVITKEDQGKQMNPPFLLALDWAVLSDPDDVRVRFLQKTGLDVAPVAAKLIVTRLSDGANVLEREVKIGPNTSIERVDVSQFPLGDYRIELQPAVPGTAHREGPRLVYHRTACDASELRVSPLAPWVLKRDPSRKEVAISDFKEAVAKWPAEVDATKWAVDRTLLGKGDVNASPLVLRPRLSGHYAIYAQVAACCYLKAGKDPIVRRIGIMGHSNAFPTPPGASFVVATDMTEGQLAIFQSGTPGQGIVSLHLVPVTAASVAAFEKETSRPPAPLAGVCDWLTYFYPGTEPRVAADQFEALVKTHSELGMRDLQWAVGRSVLYYRSNLQQITRFPAVPLEKLDPGVLKECPHFRTWAQLTSEFCTLSEVEKHHQRYGVNLQPWLAMQRHYGPGYGGVFMSRWFASHPEWQEWLKQATKPRGSTICYFFPEVRKERVDILCELAERSPDGLLVDGNRQPPMLGYHPKMVAAYKEKTGIDPQTLDASATKEREDWFRWRAGFFTETLRELKTRLEPVRQRTGCEIPVIVRIPSAGMLYSLAQGFDVETWCREKLLHRLELEPLEDFGGRGSHDVRPYVAIDRRHGIPVWGGVNANTMRNASAVMKRALGLHEAGIAGLYFYESSNLSATDPMRWLIPLLGHRDRLSEFLNTSNIEACDPVKATDCCSGFDNHSRYDAPSSHDVLGRTGKIAL
ncbi:MAG: hypothetical protein FJ395_19390 [Verrucomicrobia bacterium]|nr:hypothetical protein [Verrucomicrobiota bacterium]